MFNSLEGLAYKFQSSYQTMRRLAYIYQILSRFELGGKHQPCPTSQGDVFGMSAGVDLDIFNMILTHGSNLGIDNDRNVLNVIQFHLTEFKVISNLMLLSRHKTNT